MPISSPPSFPPSPDLASPQVNQVKQPGWNSLRME